MNTATEAERRPNRRPKFRWQKTKRTPAKKSQAREESQPRLQQAAQTEINVDSKKTAVIRVDEVRQRRDTGRDHGRNQVAGARECTASSASWAARAGRRSSRPRTRQASGRTAYVVHHIMQSVFSSAARRRITEERDKLERRGGELKTGWTEPLHECRPMGFEWSVPLGK